MAALAPARLVPCMKTPDGLIVGETLAMAESLAERHPEAGLWPADPAARALARWLCAEMHAGFTALRGACPMQLVCQYSDFTPSVAVRADLDRISTLWALARDRHGANGPWLFGDYSVADAFYAPVAARIAGYGLDVDDTAQAYVATTLADPAFRRWRAQGLRDPFRELGHARGDDLELARRRRSAWARPNRRTAKAHAAQTLANSQSQFNFDRDRGLGKRTR